MSQKNERYLHCIFGPVGYGKTRYNRRYLAKFSRAIIVEGDFPDEPDQYPGILLPDLSTFDDYMMKNMNGLFRARIAARPEDFPFICEWAKVAGDCALFVDEADRYLIPGRVDPAFMDLVARGRHYGRWQGVSLSVVTQNPMQIPIDVRRQATHMIIFNQAEPADKEWLGKLIGKEWEEKCPLLQKFEFIEWEKGKGAVIKNLSEVGA